MGRHPAAGHRAPDRARAAAALTGRGEPPGEVGGQPITAGHLRALLTDLDALGLRAPAGGSLDLALTDPDGTLRATCTPGRLDRLARRGCPAHPAGDCGCPLLDSPPATTAHRPTDAQRRSVRTRDRTRRFPNCARPVGWTDCDHAVPHADGGGTGCTNLCCLCRSHHRLKTLARGWSFALDEDGTLHVTTPAGITRSTRPPGLIDRPEMPPQAADAVDPADPPDRPGEEDPPF